MLVPGGLHPGGGVSIQRGLHPRNLHPGGLYPEGCLHPEGCLYPEGVSIQRGISIQGSLHPEGVWHFLPNWHLVVAYKPGSMHLTAVADPGFSRGGYANSQKCYYFSNFFAENCMKMKEFGPPGAGVSGAPLDPPMYWNAYMFYNLFRLALKSIRIWRV